jgi:regulation of enolase protein 1 (concanavalin A-like superfamily)
MMLFAGQETVEFGSANYSAAAFVPPAAYTNYAAETVFLTSDPAVVDSFKTKFDDSWIDRSNFANYANITTALTRSYPTYPLDADLNFPPAQDYAARAVPLYNQETVGIDAIMYRITDRRHVDAMIAAHARGVPVRLIVENNQYRNPTYLWDAWNVDRMYAAGIKLRWRGHAGENHEKVVLLYGQNRAIFGSSNWTTASANSQQEHNYFTTKNALVLWFEAQFARMWNNTHAAETAAFVPLPPDPPKNRLPANGSAVAGTSATLTWYGGPWAHTYDLYFGTSPTPPLVKAAISLGPSTTTATVQKFVASNLAPGTTYYWRIVSKTMANAAASGSVWSFTTSASGGVPPAPWSDADVGSVGAAGDATYSSGTFSVSGSGADIFGSSDAFHFVYKPLTGDGTIVARVASIANVNSWSKAGVMIRASLASNAAYALMLVSSAKGTALQYRKTNGASAASITGTAGAAPMWVKIVRAGSVITGYQSSNGATWQKVGSVTLTIGATVQVGLAVTSHDNARLCTASFTNVS